MDDHVEWCIVHTFALSEMPGRPDPSVCNYTVRCALLFLFASRHGWAIDDDDDDDDGR